MRSFPFALQEQDDTVSVGSVQSGSRSAITTDDIIVSKYKPLKGFTGTAACLWSGCKNQTWSFREK